MSFLPSLNFSNFASAPSAINSIVASSGNTGVFTPSTGGGSGASSTLSGIGAGIGTAIGGPIGGVIGSLAGTLSSGYFSNFSGFLETGSLSCLGRQTYKKSSFERVINELNQELQKGVEYAANYCTYRVLKCTRHLRPGGLSSRCSIDWCKKIKSFVEETLIKIYSQYDFDTKTARFPYANGEYTGTFHSNPRLKGATPSVPNGSNSGMSQDDFLSTYGEQYASYAMSNGLDVQDYIATKYKEHTGINWNFNASSNGNGGVNWSASAGNTKNSINWLLLLLVGGGAYFLAKKK